MPSKHDCERFFGFTLRIKDLFDGSYKGGQSMT